MKRIFIAGHRGMVGSAIVRALQRRQKAGEAVEILVQTRQQLDLTQCSKVKDYFRQSKPTHVILAAAKVGGIKANSDAPVEFLLENLKIQNNVIEAAHDFGVGKLLFLGSSCIYPKQAPQPIKEDSLLTGPLEPTNECYAIAKIAGLKLCQAYRKEFGDDFVSAMPTNLYGPGDNFDPETGHALPSMIYKFHHAKAAGAKSVKLWGTGTPRREWLHVDDAASASLLILESYSSSSPINIGLGEDITISELADIVKGAVGFSGTIEWDLTMPDGVLRKVLNVDRVRALGWKQEVSLLEGIRAVYDWFCQHAVVAPSSTNRW